MGKEASLVAFIVRVALILAFLDFAIFGPGLGMLAEAIQGVIGWLKAELVIQPIV